MSTLEKVVAPRVGEQKSNSANALDKFTDPKPGTQSRGVEAGLSSISGTLRWSSNGMKPWSS